MNTFAWGQQYLVGAPAGSATEAPSAAAPVASPFVPAAAMPPVAPSRAAIDEPARPRVRSFDVFDTLIARRCVEPHRVFDMVGERLGMPGFTEARKAAEARIAAHAYDLDMIYDELARALQLSAEQAGAIKALEVEIELEQVVPISENLARVRHGDVLISDMYLGETIIRQLLHKAGLDRKVSLVVTSDGKKSGAIWPQVAANLDIEEHLGDNDHSDVASPASFGIEGRHTKVHGLTGVEEVLAAVGLPQLAGLCRETRLRTWSEDQQVRSLQLVQASLNLPLLLLSSVALARLAARLDKRSILFSSRDCDMWRPLFDKIAARMGLDCTSSYFYTSRLTRTQPSTGYMSYARRLVDEDALVVDLCGSGWSLKHLAQSLGLSDLPVFFFHQLRQIEVYERKASSPESCRLFNIVPPDVPDLDCSFLEMANYTDHGMVVDVRMIHDFGVPVFAREYRSAAALSLVHAQQQTFRTGVDLLDHYDLADVMALDDESIRTVCAALYDTLMRQRQLPAAYLESHVSEDKSVLQQIGCLA